MQDVKRAVFLLLLTLMTSHSLTLAAQDAGKPVAEPSAGVPSDEPLSTGVAQELSVGHSLPSGTQKVTVVNEPKVTATIAGTPSVSVANTPNVSIVNLPDVKVAGTPQVAISGTPVVTVSETVDVELFHPFRPGQKYFFQTSSGEGIEGVIADLKESWLRVRLTKDQGKIKEGSFIYLNAAQVVYAHK